MEVGLPMGDALKTLRETEHTRYPVYEDDLDHIIGYVHAKDLMRAVDGDGSFDLRTLARPLPHVPSEAPARQLLRELREQRVQVAVILDEHGGTAGIATFEDLIEEIFGEVQDEFDLEEPPIRRLTPAIALVDGALRVDELNESFHLALPDDLVDSVGGLVLHALGRTARLGDVVRFEGATLTVESVRGFAVTRVRLELKKG
jgi:CBS domain containing-hemolysin-like protein